MHGSLCTAVASVPNNVSSRAWTLRDDNHSHYHSVVRIAESPLYLTLHWRESQDTPVLPVGVFKLDLQGLLAGGYIREEPVGSAGSDVRLRIIRDPAGGFYIEAKQEGPRLRMDSPRVQS
jgi:hypothetical protein